VYFNTAWDYLHPGLGNAPTGDYEITATLQSGSIGGDTMATAQATFLYNAREEMNPIDSPVVDFSATPTKLKAGVPVTLTWKVTGAESVSIDQGIGSVDAQGSKPVTPVTVEPVDPAKPAGNYIAIFNLTATNTAGVKTVASKQVIIEPLTIDEIFTEYEKWGTNAFTYKWPDGSSDSKPLVGPSWCGGSNNLWETLTSITNIGSYEGLRWDCQAMQYRSLVCLNEMKQQGKLLGWDYMPVEGKTIARTAPYWEHQAVAIWKTGEEWSNTATVLDPHDRQAPHRYSVTDGLDSIAPWYPDGDYSEVYPNIPDSIASFSHKYQFDEFDKNTGNRWGNGQGAKTPWQNPVTIQDKLQAKAKAAWAANIEKPIEDVLDKPLTDVFRMAGVFCPANVLITNAAGQRLGKLADGTMVTEFQPLYADYWSDETGDKQWVFGLLDGTYKIDITGTSSGNFRLLTYTGGESINDYGENPIAAGKQAVLTMQSGTVGQLTLPDGTKVTPIAKTIDTLFTPKESTPASISDNGSLNWPLIAGVLAGLIVILGLLSKARKKTK
jgi:hypothetical protein